MNNLKHFLVYIFQCLCLVLPINVYAGGSEKVITLEYPTYWEDVTKELPLYVFKRDSTTMFIQQFADTLLGDNQILLIKSSDNAKYEKNSLPKGNIFVQGISSLYMDKRSNEYMNECKGVVILSQYEGKIGLLFSDCSSFIDKLHLTKTNNKVLLCSGESYQPKNWIRLNYSDYDAWAVLKVLPDGKVDPLMLYYGYYPVQLYEPYYRRYSWMADFYKGTDWHPGYLDQEILDPDYIRAKEQQKPKVFPPDRIEL